MQRSDRSETDIDSIRREVNKNEFSFLQKLTDMKQYSPLMDYMKL